MLAVVIILNIMKTVQTILTKITALLIGMATASLWISKTESYKIYVPIVLVLILTKILIKENDSK